MNRSLFVRGSVCVLLAAAGALAEEPPQLDAKAILDKVAETYAAMETYQAEGTALLEMETVFGSMNATTAFSMKLKKPNLYVISWTQRGFPMPGMEQSGAVWNGGEQAYLYVSVADTNAYSKMKSDEMALAGATGISGGVAHTIPALFFANFQPQLGSGIRLKDSKIEKTEAVEGEEYYIVSGSSAISKKETLWISAQNHVILRWERSLEPPDETATPPKITDEELDEGIKAMGMDPTKERREEMRAQMERSKETMKSADVEGIMREFHENISSPEFKPDDFEFAVPEGAELKESLFEGMSDAENEGGASSEPAQTTEDTPKVRELAADLEAPVILFTVAPTAMPYSLSWHDGGKTLHFWCGEPGGYALQAYDTLKKELHPIANGFNPNPCHDVSAKDGRTVAIMGRKREGRELVLLGPKSQDKKSIYTAPPGQVLWQACIAADGGLILAQTFPLGEEKVPDQLLLLREEDGYKAEVLFTGPGVAVLDFCVAPDSESLFWDGAILGEPPEATPFDYIRQAGSTEPDPLPPKEVHYFGCWAPDSAQIAYARRKNNPQRMELRAWDIKSRSSRLLATHPQGWTFSEAAWSPDGKAIAYTVSQLPWPDEGGGAEELWLVSVETAQSRRLAADWLAETERQSPWSYCWRSLTWTPDSKSFAFVRCNSVRLLRIPKPMP